MTRKKRKLQPRIAPPPKKELPWLLPALLLVYAILLRLLFWTTGEDRDFLYSAFYYGDTLRFHKEAVEILKAGWNSGNLPYHPPAINYLLALFYRIAGTPPEHLTTIKVFWILLSSLQIIPFYLLMKKYFSPPMAVLASLLYGASFPLMVISVAPNTESLFLLLTMICFLLYFHLINHWKLSTAIWLGVIAGINSLTRAEFASFFFLWLAGVLFQHRREPHLKKILIMIVFPYLITFVPWTLRNYSVLTRYNETTKEMEPLSVFVPVSNYGPLNFAMANNPKSNGKFNRDLLVGQYIAALQLAHPQHRYYFLHGYKEGLKYITEHPRAFLSLCTQKLHWASHAFALGFTPYNLPGGLNGVRYPVDIFVPNNKLMMFFTLPLFLAGMVMAWKDRRILWPFFLLLFHRLAVTLLFFGYVRGIVAIYFIVFLFLFYPFKNTVPAKSFLVAAAGFFLFCSLLPAIRPVQFIGSGPSDSRGFLIQDAEIRIYPKK